MSKYQQLQLEFTRAEIARQAGNEGQARVCARRAAGIAIREYLTRNGESVRSVSAYELISHLTGRSELSPHLKLICDHLTLRVTEEFKLPIEVDLVTEARILCKTLLPEWEDT